MIASEYIEKWLSCLHFYGVGDFSGNPTNPKLSNLAEFGLESTLKAIASCIPDNDVMLRKRDNIYGNLIGINKILSNWLTEDMVKLGLFPIFSSLSGEFLLVSFKAENKYDCRWLHSRYFYHQQEGLSRHLSSWQGFPWEIVNKIKRKGRFYWDNVEIESWADIE